MKVGPSEVSIQNYQDRVRTKKYMSKEGRSECFLYLYANSSLVPSVQKGKGERLRGTHCLSMHLISETFRKKGYCSDLLCDDVTIKVYSTRYRFSKFYDSDRSQIDNWSSWHAHVHISLTLWLARILLKCVFYALVKLKMLGTSISLEAEPSSLISQKGCCLSLYLQPRNFTTSSQYSLHTKHAANRCFLCYS